MFVLRSVQRRLFSPVDRSQKSGRMKGALFIVCTCIVVGMGVLVVLDRWNLMNSVFSSVKDAKNLPLESGVLYLSTEDELVAAAFEGSCRLNMSWEACKRFDHFRHTSVSRNILDIIQQASLRNVIIAGDTGPWGLGNSLSMAGLASVWARWYGGICFFTFFQDNDLLVKNITEMPSRITNRRSVNTSSMLNFPCYPLRPSVMGLLRAALREISSNLTFTTINNPIDPPEKNCTSKTERASFKTEVIDLGSGAGIPSGLGDVGVGGGGMRAPANMPPEIFWKYYREAFEQMISPTEGWMEGRRQYLRDITASTICGHMRNYRLEGMSNGGPVSTSSLDCEQDCKPLIGMEHAFKLSLGGALDTKDRSQRLNYFVSSGFDCTRCIPKLAPTLWTKATRILPPLEERHVDTVLLTGKRGYEKSKGVHVDHGDAVGAWADIGALSRCGIVIADDTGCGTFIAAVAASGGLVDCGTATEFFHRSHAWMPISKWNEDKTGELRVKCRQPGALLSPHRYCPEG